MWAKDANLDGDSMNLSNAIDYANNLCLGTSCGTPRTDWRLPNIKELLSLIDYNNYNPPLPTGHPFLNVYASSYWSSTTSGGDINSAWRVSLGPVNTGSYNYDKIRLSHAWPVRGGN
jgi:hypothetical protein